jgi:hypothetical protein
MVDLVCACGKEIEAEKRGNRVVVSVNKKPRDHFKPNFASEVVLDQGLQVSNSMDPGFRSKPRLLA